MQGLLKVLDASPDIVPIVQSLTLRGVESPKPRNRTHDYWDDPEGVMLLWERLPNLRVLKFFQLSFRNGLHQLIPFAYSLPNLEELVLIGIDAAPETTDVAFSPYRNSIVQPRTPPKLKRLNLSGCCALWLFLEDLARLLLEPGMHAPLETLDLNQCLVMSPNTRLLLQHSTDTVPSQAWAPVIASLAQTLRHCTLGLLSYECCPANPANLYGSLKQCTNLRSLGVVSMMPPAAFLDALADLLLSPTDSYSPSPFPHFEALSVQLFQTNELVLDGCADACEKLARALEDRSRYPHLKHVDICAKTEEHSGTADGCRSIGEKLKEQEAIFRCCFGRMQAIGVEVEISMWSARESCVEGL